MTTKRNIITLLIMLSLSLGIFANGNGEKEQKLSKLIIKEGNTVVDEFSIIRDANLGQELFYIVSSNEGRKYYVDLVSSSDIVGGNPVTFEISKDDDIGIEIEGVNSYVSPLSSSDLDLRRLNPVHNYYKPEITQIGVRLISYDTPANSYQFILKVHPTVTINSDQTISDSVLKESLRDNAIYRRFFRKQVLGDSSFTATDSNPFPIANLENHYDYIMENNSTADETIVDRVQFETFIRPFDVIYNHDVNDNEEMGDSIIYKFLKVYFNNDKPLFHSYINEYMDENFNYHQYDKITAVEGKELVNHALKYLTWGLEYTPEKNYRAITGGDNIYPSQLLNYEGAANEEAYNDLTKWIRTTTSNDINRNRNYLGFDPEEINELVNASDVTYNQDRIDELQALAGNYFIPASNNDDANEDDTPSLQLTTPFKVGETVVTGSALPYVKGGIDTPRTFNYKMTEQFDIVNSYLADAITTSNNNYKYLYGSEDGTSWRRNDYYYSIDNSGKYITHGGFYIFYGDQIVGRNITNHNPFTPGRVTDDKYRGLNLTGVDSLGLLSGALSMTEFYKEILNISNTAPAVNMDTLNKMTTLPSFSSNPQETQDLYRLTRNDIERSTVIIPDLSEMQPGDLLVKGSGDETDVAIVIDTGYTPGDETFYLGNVLVLTVNDIDKRVAVCYWGQNGTYSSFTNEPKNYVLRRLIKFTGNISDSDEYSFSEFTELEKTADYWDPFVFQPEPIYVHMDTSSSRNNSRWIPNTGEIYEISSIKFSPSDSDVEPIIELEDYNNAEVIIKAPSDINYDVTEAGHDNTTSGNNILVNKGDGFAFYALNTFTDSATNEEYYDAIRLATFNINTSSTNEFDRYTVEYNDDIFTSDGHCRDGYTLKYKKYEGLEFNIGIDNRFTNFGIRPLETNIRPGDDILLNFEIYDNGNSIPVNSPEREFLAVYDEKMLWRANLYIDEGGADWNSENTWNAPATTAEANNYGAVDDNGVIKRFIENSGTYSEMGMFKYHNSTDWQVSSSERVWYGANEWNKIYDFDKLVNEFHNKQGEFDINRSGILDDGNGTQENISINSSTWSYNNSNGVDQENRVAYDWNGMDGPFEFNFKTDNQKKLLAHYFKKNREYVAAGTDTLVDDIDLWDDSLAPGTNHSNYIHSSTVYSTAVLGADVTLDSAYKSITGEYKTIDNKQYYAYLPSLSNNVSKQFASPPESNKYPNDISAGYTAGTDCIGFAKNAASYEGNNYKNGTSLWGNVPTKMWGADRGFTRYPYYHELSYLITKESDKIITGYDENDDPIYEYPINEIKVGDIVYYCKSNSDGKSEGRHIMVINEILDIDGDIKTDEVILIESTDGENLGKVRKTMKLEKLIEKDKNWFIVRLRR